MEKKKRAEYIKVLNSGNEKAVLSAISKLRDEGDNEILYTLAELYQKSSSEEIKVKISGLFNDLKNQECAPYIIDIIEDKEYSDARPMLVSACWQSRLDFADYLEVFIKMVIEEPFITAFEAFTVIENTESKFTKDRKHELIEFAKQKSGKSSEENFTLIHDIPQIIEQYEEL